MSLISFRSSFSSNQKSQVTILSKTPSKSSLSQALNFKSFKRFTYEALNQKDKKSNNEKNIQPIQENDSDDCNISSEERENDSNGSQEKPLLKMEKYSKEACVKKNLNLDNNTLQFDQLISQYYFNNNNKKEKTNENMINNLKEILAEISRKQRNIEKQKEEIVILQNKLNSTNKNKYLINVTNSNCNNNIKASNFLTERTKTFSQNSNALNMLSQTLPKTKSTTSTNSTIPNKIQIQKRYIKFKELVSKLKNQIIEQKKKERNNRLFTDMSE